MIKSDPIRIKITDFGESRTAQEQTQTILRTNTINVARGTLGFMAPECLPGKLQLKLMREYDLIVANVWSYCALLHLLLNPDNPPLCLEVGMSWFDCMNTNQAISNMYMSGELPRMSPSYEKERLVYWGKVLCAYFMCSEIART